MMMKMTKSRITSTQSLAHLCKDMNKRYSTDDNYCPMNSAEPFEQKAILQTSGELLTTTQYRTLLCVLILLRILSSLKCHRRVAARFPLIYCCKIILFKQFPSQTDIKWFPPNWKISVLSVCTFCVPFSCPRPHPNHMNYLSRKHLGRQSIHIVVAPKDQSFFCFRLLLQYFKLLYLLSSLTFMYIRSQTFKRFSF